MGMVGRVFFKWRVANLLVGFPDIAFFFGTRVRSLPDALQIATPTKRLPGAGGGFLTRGGGRGTRQSCDEMGVEALGQRDNQPNERGATKG